MTVAALSLDAAVWQALDTVRDPELDRPITDLGFVSRCQVGDGAVSVELRLPTYFCAPNFAFLMVADAYDAVSAVPGVVHASVELLDHFASEQINAGVAARAGFVASFAGEATDELDTLRRDFVRKAVMAGTYLVAGPLVRAGRDVSTLSLGDVPPSPALDSLVARRREIGLPTGDDAPLVVDVETGDPVAADRLPLHLGRARLSQVNIEANTSICSGMLAHRYPEETTR